MPKPGTANYAFLVVMYMAKKQENRRHWDKEDLMEAAERSGLAERSIHRVKDLSAGATAANWFDGWTCFRGLITRDPPLASERNKGKGGRGKDFTLTNLGWAAAARLYKSALRYREVPPLPGVTEAQVDDDIRKYYEVEDMVPELEAYPAGTPKQAKRGRAYKGFQPQPRTDDEGAAGAAEPAAAGQASGGRPRATRRRRVSTVSSPDSDHLPPVGSHGAAAGRAPLGRQGSSPAVPTGLPFPGLLGMQLTQAPGDAGGVAGVPAPLSGLVRPLSGMADIFTAAGLAFDRGARAVLEPGRVTVGLAPAGAAEFARQPAHMAPPPSAAAAAAAAAAEARAAATMRVPAAAAGADAEGARAPSTRPVGAAAGVDVVSLLDSSDEDDGEGEGVAPPDLPSARKEAVRRSLGASFGFVTDLPGTKAGGSSQALPAAGLREVHYGSLTGQGQGWMPGAAAAMPPVGAGMAVPAAAPTAIPGGAVAAAAMAGAVAWRGPRVAVDEGMLDKMMELGFDRRLARKALRLERNDFNAALDQLDEQNISPPGESDSSSSGESDDDEEAAGDEGQAAGVLLPPHPLLNPGAATAAVGTWQGRQALGSSCPDSQPGAEGAPQPYVPPARLNLPPFAAAAVTAAATAGPGAPGAGAAAAINAGPKPQAAANVPPSSSAAAGVGAAVPARLGSGSGAATAAAVAPPLARSGSGPAAAGAAAMARSGSGCGLGGSQPGEGAAAFRVPLGSQESAGLAGPGPGSQPLGGSQQQQLLRVGSQPLSRAGSGSQQLHAAGSQPLSRAGSQQPLGGSQPGTTGGSQGLQAEGSEENDDKTLCSYEWPLPRVSEVTANHRALPVRLPPLEPGKRFEDVYEVVMLVDNREPPGLVEALRRHTTAQGVRMLAGMSLNVGDFLWVAARRGAPLNHLESRDKWYVLDAVLERKKASDLLSSVRDGRYAQQKYRLQRCGLRRLYYLLEEPIDQQQFQDVDVKTLRTAVQSALLEGFVVLRTHNGEDTARQLAMLTRALSRQYQGRSAAEVTAAGSGGASGSGQVQVEGQVQVQDDPLPTYTAWDGGLKSLKQNMKVQAMFGLMLCAVPGLGEEYASRVLLRYNTPAMLWEHYKATMRRAAAAGGDPTAAAEQMLTAEVGALRSARIYQLLFSKGAPAMQIVTGV